MFADSPSNSIHKIAESVMRLSDFYIENPMSETPWHEKYCQEAYRNYYLPLNLIRCQKVIERGLQVNFFQGLNTFYDWGAGPGTASLALAVNSHLNLQIEKQILFDISTEVLSAFADLHSILKSSLKTTQLNLQEQKNKKTSCLVFSYSFTEVSQLPEAWDQYEALMILEPSTSQDGRRLLDVRKTLIENGYSIWAPCTQQGSCPLLLHSKHDWCHDRAHVQAPEWFEQLENLLPMKNRTVTTSYLLARKTAPPDFIKKLARTTGDSLEEKGKTRQLVCRSENREYLSWMHKNIEPQIIARGELISVPTDVEVKSNELRVHSPIDVQS